MNEIRIKTIEEYYVFLEELQELLRKGHELKNTARVAELEEMLDEFEKATFPVGVGPHRAGGRF
jgi:hypothetical protein